MPDLYQLSVGSIGAAYYQKQFARFETLGKAVPSWNSGAAFFTVAWLLLRKMWRPAALYAGVLIALVLLWMFALHGRVPRQVEATVCMITVLLLCAIPGFLANGWFYNRVRTNTLNTLTQASSIGQARATLAVGSASKKRLHTIATIQAIVGIALAAWITHFLGHTSAKPQVSAPSGPPALIIPSVASLQPSAPEVAPVLTITEPTAPAALSEPASEPEASMVSSTLSAIDSTPTIALPTNTVTALVTPADTTPTITADEPATPTPATVDTPQVPTPVSPPAPAIKPTPVQTPAKAPATKAEAKPTAKSKPAATAPAPSTASSSTTNRLIPGKYYLNAGVYAQAANVDRSVKQLQTAKLNTLRQTISSNKGELTRLRIGPFDTRKQAEQAAATAKRLRIDTTVFQQPKP